MIRAALQHRLRAYRNPIYIVYTALGIGIFTLGLLIARGPIGLLELYFFRFMNELPGFLTPLFTLISLFGTIGFVFVATGVSIVRKHYAHSLKFLLAGVTAWLVVKWLKTFEFRPRPSEILPNVQLRESLDSVIGYPSGHAAVVAALGVVAYHSLPKKFHKYITFLIISVCLSRLFLGMHLPVDVIGGFGIGLAIASVLNFIFGDTQGKNISITRVKEKIKALGVNAVTVERAKVDARGSTPFFVTEKGGRKLFVKIVDTSNNVADWLFKLSRKAIYKRLEDEAPFFTPKRQLEHEAYVAGLAFANGVQTPPIVGIFHVKEDMWAMSQEMIPGMSLDKVKPSDITDKLLKQVWQQVRKLHDANIIHRDLRAANVFVDSNKKAWLIDFGFSEASVPKRMFYRDTVELIASLSCIVESKRVIRSAREVIDKKELERALPYLSYASLSGATTALLKKRKGLLEEIRTELESELGLTKPIKAVKIKRFDLRTALYVLMIGVAVYVLIPQISDLNAGIDSVIHGNLFYLALVILCSIFTYPPAAEVYVQLAPHPISFFKTLLISVSTSFTNRLLPASTGAIATNIQYLRKNNFSLTQASSITALNNLVGVIGHFVILLIVAGLSQTPLNELITVHISRWVFIFAGLVLFSCVLAVVTITNLRKRAKKILISLRGDLTQLFEKPLRFLFALLSAMLITTFYAMALYFSAEVVGQSITILQAFYVFTIGVTAASVTPTPGGIGGAEAGLVAGFVSVGLDSSTALSITLVYRFVTFWLPIIPGAIAFHFASKRKYI